MCTLTWKPTAAGYALFFNRDERRERAAASPPRLMQRNGMAFLAPLDPAGGGTWLLVNAAGLSVGLLNNYAAANQLATGRSVSRGLLTLACADCAGIADAVSRVRGLPLADYAPFHLVLANATGAHRLTWDGSACVGTGIDPAGALLTTSSFAPNAVEAARHAHFARLVGEMARATLSEVHAFHEYQGEDAASGVRMSRPDACTHSISRIAVSLSRGEARFSYRPSAEIQPGAAASAVGLQLDLRQAA